MKMVYGSYHWWSSDGRELTKEDIRNLNQQKRQIDKIRKINGKISSDSIMKIKKYYR